MQTATPSVRSASPVRTQQDSLELYDELVDLHTSTFRSRYMELNIISQSIEHVDDPKFIGQPIPVFTGKDSVEGTIATAIPALISTDHRLMISIEGAFFWIGPQKEEPQALPLTSPLPMRVKHVFYSSTLTIPLSPFPFDTPLKPQVTIRSALQDGLRNALFRTSTPQRRRRGGPTSSKTKAGDPYTKLDSAKTFHRFTFPLPVINNHEIPGTISVSRLCSGGIRGRWYAEGAQIAYKLTAQVYPVASGKEDTRTLEDQLEAPIFIESSSIEKGLNIRNSWSHTELICLRDLPFKCMLSLPQPASFSRSDTIVYYVFFTTSPKSETLARKIIKGSSIRVSLIRQLRLDSGLAISASSPHTLYSDDTHSTPEQSSERPRRRVIARMPKIFKWQKAPTDPVWTDKRDSTSGKSATSTFLKNKPLPALPKDSSTVYEDVICSEISYGFPKRVAQQGKPPSAYESGTGSDGVFMGQLHLSNELSNTIDWPGISLSYFVEANVLFENEALRARHRVRLAEAYI